MDLKERFLKYVAFDTQSDESSTSFPSTDKQLVLLRHLKEELEAIGLDVPVISKIATRLKNAGVKLDGTLYTVDGVKEAIIKLLGGKSK